MARDALRVTAVLATALLALSCSSDGQDSTAEQSGSGRSDAVADESIDATSVETQVATNLSDLGLAPDRVACPTNLSADVGATARCEVRLDGVTFGVTVEVASTDGDQAVLDVKVDDQPS